MLITHVKPAELWGKKAYDGQGRCLGEVVAIASRRGVAYKVAVLKRSGRTARRQSVTPEARPRLWVLH